ncbi:hypothetical protein GCM10022252_63090 [Streptosporangium oxazolinicum]|uniref:Uncharacterized protein n=1 Tax=Streptosporangium oxazolinicum TaxID=909287 RepID=A0ABP8BDK2_9ACTN
MTPLDLDTVTRFSLVAKEVAPTPVPEQDVVTVPTACLKSGFSRWAPVSRASSRRRPSVTSHIWRPVPLRALVGEPNGSGHVWFVPHLDALDARLGVQSS